MAVIDVFDWHRALGGYGLLPIRSSKRAGVSQDAAAVYVVGPLRKMFDADLRSIPDLAIVPKVAAAKVETIKPIQINPQLYLHFARLDGSPEQCLAFANSFGLLGLSTGDHFESVGQWQLAISALQRAIAAMAGRDDRGGVDHFRRNDYLDRPLATIEVALRPDPKAIATSLQIAYRPRSLKDAIWIQFAHAIASGNEVARCRQCSEPFERGPSAPRRAKSQFCSDQCRFAFNYSKRKGATK